MILKRTKSLKRTAAAMEWVGGYVNEVEKHKGKDLGQVGLGIGRKYFSTRPPGLLTAHGYIRGEVDEIRRRIPLESGDRAGVARNNRAIQEFVHRHCRAQREKKRKIIALRLVASLDPDKVQEIVRYPIDLDRLLVTAIERTLNSVAEKHYPGDELGYVIGLHHDALDRLQRPHLHGHVFLLPQTRAGVLISVSNHSRPGRDGKYADMLSETKDLFHEAAMDSVYSTAPARYKSFATQEWDDLAREISMKTVETVSSGRQMSPERTRKYAINTFFFYVKKTHQVWLKRRLQALKDRIAELEVRGPAALVGMVRDLYEGMKELMRPRFEERRGIANQVLPEFQKERVACVTSDCHMKQTRTCLVEWRTVGNRRKLIEVLMQEIEDRRMAARISMLSELGIIDLHLAAAGLTVNPPAWIQRLEICIRGDKLPNKELIDRTNTQNDMDAPSPDTKVPAADVESATQGLPIMTASATPSVTGTPSSL
ncbi:MAG: hypothetical protein IH623_11300 [Verrucomicrobia bacterium]|nr:hypothetical protein [Verrucomicrobiota bacterium]